MRLIRLFAEQTEVPFRLACSFEWEFAFDTSGKKHTAELAKSRNHGRE